jgi:hypothetical protein
LRCAARPKRMSRRSSSRITIRVMRVATYDTHCYLLFYLLINYFIYLPILFICLLYFRICLFMNIFMYFRVLFSRLGRAIEATTSDWIATSLGGSRRRRPRGSFAVCYPLIFRLDFTIFHSISLIISIYLFIFCSSLMYLFFISKFFFISGFHF